LGHPKSRRNDGMTEPPTEQHLANTYLLTPIKKQTIIDETTLVNIRDLNETNNFKHRINIQIKCH